MVSISPEQHVETRQFMDDEHQITIGIPAEIWPILQELANHEAKQNNWLNGRGSPWAYLNIWINRRLVAKPDEVEPWEWIAKAAYSS